MRFQTLDEWLSWQEGLHPTAMDLGLTRVRIAAGKMDWPAPSFPQVTVAGTNGKGSSVSYLEAILTAQGYKVGTYTSPHLVRYNERIRVNGEPVEDGAICDAFHRIDLARGDMTITYFEFGTLAAMDVFHQMSVDVAVMEVGIGGELDAVNIFDADVALITAIDIDHQKWLGSDRETIGLQKAGIMRAKRPVIVSDPKPPKSVLDKAVELEAPLYQLGVDYRLASRDLDWDWIGPTNQLAELPAPGLKGDFQRNNAAGAIMALMCLAPTLSVSRNAISRGLASPGLKGRFETIGTRPEVIVDVGHNPHATKVLAENLETRPSHGRTIAVAGLLVDKNINDAIKPVVPQVDEWFITGLEGPRGDDGSKLAEGLSMAGAEHVSRFSDGLSAFEAAMKAAGEADRVVVFGSFYLVGDVLAHATHLVHE